METVSLTALEVQEISKQKQHKKNEIEKGIAERIVSAANQGLYSVALSLPRWMIANQWDRLQFNDFAIDCIDSLPNFPRFDSTTSRDNYREWLEMFIKDNGEVISGNPPRAIEYEMIPCVIRW